MLLTFACLIGLLLVVGSGVCGVAVFRFWWVLFADSCCVGLVGSWLWCCYLFGLA